ncbi:MAG: hypothetical protein ACREGI_05500 [Candidatus Levyibacteriota bacterium]
MQQKPHPKQLEIEEEVWDKKKIIIGVIIFLLLAGGAVFAKAKYFPSPSSSVSPVEKNVEGISSTQSGLSQNSTQQNVPSFSLPSAADLEGKVKQLQDQIAKLSLSDIASSSPQIQKIIQDASSIQQLPMNEAKGICQKICGGVLGN